MTELLKEYYGLEIDNVKEYNDGIIFFVNGDYYYLCKCNLEYTDVLKCYRLVDILKRKQIRLHEFVYNINNELISENYVLLKLNNIISDIDFFDLKFIDIEYDLKDDFYLLWTSKIDYLESLLFNGTDNALLAYSFDYFVGIAEMLLMFYRDNKNDSGGTYLVHRLFNNLSTVDFYNPLNLVVGDKYKDIAFFIRLTNDWDLLFEILNDISYKDKVVLFVRMTFPFEYFRFVYKYVNNRVVDDELIKIVSNIELYEDYLLKIEQLFNIRLFDFIKKI